MRSRKQAAAKLGTSLGASLEACPVPARTYTARNVGHLKAFYRTRHREGSGHDSAQTTQNGIAADDDDRSDDGIMGDTRAAHAAGRPEQMLTGRIPAHDSREGPGGCNIWT